MPKIIAIDYGSKRCGLAATDNSQIIASALTTVDTKEIFKYLTDYFLKNEVEGIVLGEPKRLDGSDTDATPLVENFKLKLIELFPEMPIVMIDERLTSRMAKQTLIDAGYKKIARQNKKLVDTVAAALILQTYLASK